MRITHEVNQLLEEGTDGDAEDKDDAAEVDEPKKEECADDPDQKPDLFKLLSPMKRSDGALYPPSSQGEEDDVETASTVTRNTDAEVAAASLTERSHQRPHLRLFAEKLLQNSGQPVTEANIENILKVKLEKTTGIKVEDRAP